MENGLPRHGAGEGPGLKEWPPQVLGHASSDVKRFALPEGLHESKRRRSASVAVCALVLLAVVIGMLAVAGWKREHIMGISAREPIAREPEAPVEPSPHVEPPEVADSERAKPTLEKDPFTEEPSPVVREAPLQEDTAPPPPVVASPPERGTFNMEAQLFGDLSDCKAIVRRLKGAGVSGHDSVQKAYVNVSSDFSRQPLRSRDEVHAAWQIYEVAALKTVSLHAQAKVELLDAFDAFKAEMLSVLRDQDALDGLLRLHTNIPTLKESSAEFEVLEELRIKELLLPLRETLHKASPSLKVLELGVQKFNAALLNAINYAVSIRDEIPSLTKEVANAFQSLLDVISVTIDATDVMLNVYQRVLKGEYPASLEERKGMHSKLFLGIIGIECFADVLEKRANLRDLLFLFDIRTPFASHQDPVFWQEADLVIGSLLEEMKTLKENATVDHPASVKDLKFNLP